MAAQGNDSGSGCAGCLGAFVLIALVVSAVISVAAIVDPFAWLPSLHAIFASDCESDCDLGARYPGFWPHVIVNFAFAVLALVLVIALWRTTANLRAARTARFGGPEQVERYRTAREEFAMAAVTLTLLGLVPIVVALA